MDKNNTNNFFALNSEDMEELKKKLKEEKEKIHNLKEHDFGNGVSYVQYYDEENTRHTIIHKEQEGGQYSQIRSGEVFHSWKHKITKDGSEVLTDPENGNNNFQVSSTGKGLIFDTTEFLSEEGSLVTGSKKNQKINFEVHFDIMAEGRIKITNIEGNPKNKIFFKNGDKLETVDENGKLVDVEEIDKQELLEVSKGLAGVKENNDIKSNFSHLNRVNKNSLSKTPRYI